MKGRTRRRIRRVKFPLRKILQRYGWSQRQCARASGLTASTISDLCTGRKLPSWPVLLHILTTIGADLGDLAPKGGAA
jgi:transcriptional regulator with XRE-family HTH domain